MAQLETKFNEELMKIYGWSKNKNFRVVDTIPTKHPFCITHHHVGWCSDHCGGILDIEAMEIANAYKSGCGTCGASISEHKSALLVQCLKEPTNDNKYGKELHAYLKKIIKFEHFKSKKYEGAALMSSFKKEE